jgi:hypothetical protein
MLNLKHYKAMSLGLLLLINIYVILTTICIFGIVRKIKNNNSDEILENGFTGLWILIHAVIIFGGTIIAFVFLIKYLWTIPLW